MEMDIYASEGVEEVPWGEWVWVRVFEFLSPQELASARLVCSAWARLSDDGLPPPPPSTHLRWIAL
jgi:hypothetical protein